MSAAGGKPPLPAWAETIRRKYVSGESSMFILHGNVFDQILHDGKLSPLPEFIARVLLWENKEHIVHYDPSGGTRMLKDAGTAVGRGFAESSQEDALAQLETRLMATNKFAAIFSYAGSIAPAGEESFLAQQDRLNAVRLHRWSLSPALSDKDNVVFLLSESLAELNARLVANPRIAAVEVPLPGLEERKGALRHADPLLATDQMQRLAEHTSGLRISQILHLLKPGKTRGPEDDEREKLIISLLGNTKDAETRAARLASLTLGMSVEEIRHLINPDQPLPETQQNDPYAAVLELAHRRKREIIEKECDGLIEFVDARHDLTAVGGNAAIKQELMQIAAAVHSGERARVPMGLLFVGAMGCGKTFVAKAFVKESGLSAITLKNFRSKWVGSTESNLEKVLSLVKSLGPIILIIDEGDRSFGSGSEDSDGGTSSRVIARLKEFMSDPDNRGVVLFILMTNRPDKLDIDIKRAGRLDRKIPFFYPETPQDVEAVLRALFARHAVDSVIDWDTRREHTSARLSGYSNADLEAVVLLAHDMAEQQGGPVTPELFGKAIDDYMPSRDTEMIEYMELLAVFEASRRSMLPARYRDMTLDQLRQRLLTLRHSLRL